MRAAVEHLDAIKGSSPPQCCLLPGPAFVSASVPFRQGQCFPRNQRQARSAIAELLSPF